MVATRSAGTLYLRSGPLWYAAPAPEPGAVEADRITVTFRRSGPPPAPPKETKPMSAANISKETLNFLAGHVPAATAEEIIALAAAGMKFTHPAAAPTLEADLIKTYNDLRQAYAATAQAAAALKLAQADVERFIADLNPKAE